MTAPMNSSAVERALLRLGEVIEHHRDIEILLVGGAAGMVTGVLAANRVTEDCDVMVYIPPESMSVVEAAAHAVADELGLSQRWLNSDVQIRRDALPDGWERRKVLVGMFGRLRVWSVSRPDFIAMKVLAARPQDIDDLRSIRIRADEVEFVRGYLDSLEGKGTSRGQIDAARILLDALEAHDHE